MNIRFFGDSWLWTWVSRLEGEGFHSEYMRLQGEKQWGFSTMKSLLKSFGFDVYSYCQPSNSLSQTVDIILRASDTFGCFQGGGGSNNKEVWIIFASSNFRPRPGREPVAWDMTSKDTLLKQIDSTYISDLNLLKRVMGNSEDVDIIVVSGQAEISQEVMDQVAVPRIHLLSSHILESLAHRYLWNSNVEHTQKFPRFIFETEFINRLDEWSEHHDINSVDEEILDMFNVKQDMDNAMTRYGHVQLAKQLFCWPDSGHLGYNGQVFFLDYLFKFCEDNNIMLKP